MIKGLEGFRVVEVGGVAAMPLAGMLLSTWGADVIHVEPPGRGDMLRQHLYKWLTGWAEPHPINYLWEYVSRNKKSIAVDLGNPKGQEILHKLVSTADILANNLRPYELEKFNLTYDIVSKVNPKIIYANLTGYGRRGPEKDTGGYDTVAFWARSGVMELMHEADTAPNISRPSYGDSITSISLLAGILAALLIRERTGIGQEVEVSLYNTAVYALGFDISGCLITSKDALRPHRRKSSNPIRNIYPTKDHRWIMLGMINAQHLWPGFCKALDRPELEKDPKFATYEARAQHAEELVGIIEGIFCTRTYVEWVEVLKTYNIIWSPLMTPLEVTQDEQALANDFFVDWDHPQYGKIKVLNNPIKLSKTPAEIKRKAPDLGEHTDTIMKELGYGPESIATMKKSGVIA
jgi:crotonobetainyl-CoA:carnitine CoA-transferase CaiB-like acyl-CoA transferase